MYAINSGALNMGAKDLRFLTSDVVSTQMTVEKVVKES